MGIVPSSKIWVRCFHSFFPTVRPFFHLYNGIHLLFISQPQSNLSTTTERKMRYLLQTSVINRNFVLIQYFPRNVMISFLCKYVYIIIWTYFDILTGLSTSATVFYVLLAHQDDLDVHVISTCNTIALVFFAVLKTALVLNPKYHTALQIY
jgi:hypothetical protein